MLLPISVQRPLIPTLIGGGAGPVMFRHVAEWADGWLPIGGRGVREAVPKLHEAWAAADRSGTPQIIPFGTVPSHEKLEYYASVGCTEVVLRLESYDRDGALRQLDDLGQYLTR